MHPYKGKPDYQFWRKAGGIDEPSSLDPVTHPKFRIGRNDAVVTAGSCFAQHVARRLKDNGFNFFVCERAHPLFSTDLAKAHNYGAFSAHYGNIYTARQLRQLIERVYGVRTPTIKPWLLDNGRYVDPFRPQIQPGGFISEAELELDRERHLKATRLAFKKMKVFVFTLGLTEAWVDNAEGNVLPLAPGVAGGDYDPALYSFVNFSLDETLKDLSWSLNFLRKRRPECKFIPTVSPVPLNATAEDRHVLVSTTYSKAVLRLAAEEMCKRLDDCDYFPSFEIITAPQTRGLYFGPDRRDVTEAGVDHVMGLFLKHYGDTNSAPAKVILDRDQIASAKHIAEMDNIIKVLCDEEAIDN